MTVAAPWLSLGFLNLGRHSRRTVLVGAAIATVTFLNTVALSLANGIEAQATDTTRGLLSGELNLAGVYKTAPGVSFPLMLDAAAMEKVVRGALPDVTAISPRLTGQASLIGSGVALDHDVTLAGVDLSREPLLAKALSLREGRLEDALAPGGVLLFAKQATELKVGLGDRVVLSTTNRKGGRNIADVRVGAIAENVGFLSGYVVLTGDRTARDLLLYREGATSALLIHLANRDADHAKELQATLLAALKAAGVTTIDTPAFDPESRKTAAESEYWVGQRVQVTTWEQEVNALAFGLSAVQALLAMVGTMLSAMVLLGLGFMLWVAVQERTREVGVLRAVGMQRPDVLRMFVVEGALLGALGALVGGLLGLLLAVILNHLELPAPDAMQFALGAARKLHLGDSPGLVITSVVINGTCAALVSIFPAWQASRLSPLEAMTR